jgi:peptide/nickel transport system permease protein
MSRAAKAAATALIALAVAAALASLIAPYAFDAVDLAGRRAAPSFSHWFGTDEVGRDLLTRILFGARVSLAVGFISGAVSVAIGVLVGGTSGYSRRRVDEALMRVTDAMLCVPRLPFLMIAAVVLNPGVPVLVLLVGAVGWMETARVVRAEVKSLKERDFVSAARAVGASPLRVALRHVIPAALPVAAVATTLAVARGILLESALSFFGVGVQPPAASWGNMLYQGQTAMSTEPWIAIFPGVFIFVTVLCLNLVGDALVQRRAP